MGLRLGIKLGERCGTGRGRFAAIGIFELSTVDQCHDYVSAFQWLKAVHS